MTWQAGKLAEIRLKAGTRTNYEASPINATCSAGGVFCASRFRWKDKSILHVLDADVLRTENYPNYVETKGVTRTLKARHPDFSRTDELTLFSPAHRRSGPAERPDAPGLHFDERYYSSGSRISSGDKIDVSMAVPKSALGDLPAVNGEPSLSDSLAFQSEFLLRYCHGDHTSCQVTRSSINGFRPDSICLRRARSAQPARRQPPAGSLQSQLT